MAGPETVDYACASSREEDEEVDSTPPLSIHGTHARPLDLVSDSQVHPALLRPGLSLEHPSRSGVMHITVC